MLRYFSSRVFSLVFLIIYATVVHTDHPLFRYYPLANRWSFHDLVDPSLGPAMAWYGWIACAAIPAVILAALIPNSVGERIPAVIYWILPVVVLYIGYLHEQIWFHQ